MDQLDLDKTLQRRRKRRRALVAILLGASLATLGAGAMSLAVFSDSQASSGAWTTGTIVLGVTPSTAFSATNILPGDTGSQTIAVSNSGTGALRYAISTSARRRLRRPCRDRSRSCWFMTWGYPGDVIRTMTWQGIASAGPPSPHGWRRRGLPRIP